MEKMSINTQNRIWLINSNLITIRRGTIQTGRRRIAHRREINEVLSIF